MNYENIIFQVVAAAKKPSFEQWVSKKKFINLETKQPSLFEDLPDKQKSGLRSKYEVAMQKLEKELAEKKRLQNKKRREQRADQWTEAKLKKEAIAWARDAIRDYPVKERAKGSTLTFGDVVDDLAANFYDQDGVPEFFKKKHMTPAVATAWIADIMYSIV